MDVFKYIFIKIRMEVDDSDAPITRKHLNEVVETLVTRSYLNEVVETLVTRAYLNEMFEKFSAKMDARFDRVEGRLDTLEGQVSTLQKQMSNVIAFQKYESLAIEHELKAVLKDHLAKKYPLRVVADFPAKKIHDPLTNKLITDLDAAFLVKPFIRRTNTRRLRNAGMIPPTGRNNAPDDNYYFILGEAKHHITRNKIAQKLWQFEKLCYIFDLAKRITDGVANPSESSRQFKMTVTRDKYISKITELSLYFGSPYWDVGLSDTFTDALQEWSDLAESFQLASTNDEKVAIFKKIVELETIWYTDTNNTNHTTPKATMTDAEIVALNEIDGAMKHVELIVPSGRRYMVQENRMAGVPEGITARANGGGMKQT
jgi:hypothetical protein